MHRTHFNKMLVILLLSGLFSFLSAQKLNFRNYDIKDGLAESIVYHISQTEKGYVLISTDGGLSIFDGKEFENFNTINGLPNSYVNYTIEDSRGNLLIGTYDGLSIYDWKSFTNIGAEEGLSDNLVWCIEEIDDSTVWLGTAKGITQLVDYKKQKLDLPDDLEDTAIWSIVNLPEKTLIGSNKGLWQYKDKEFSRIQSPGNRPNLPCFNIYKASNGIIWVGTSEGLLQIENDEITLYTDLPLDKKIIYWITEDSEGVLWLATQFGLLKYSKDEKILYDKKHGLAGNSALSVYTDAENNLWVGSNNGLSVLGDRRFSLLHDEAKFKNVWAVLSDKQNNLWIGDDTGIKKISGTDVIDINKKYRLKKSPVWTIFEDTKGRILFGCEDGLIIKNGNSYKEIRGNDFKVYDAIMSMFEDSENNLWFGTYDSGLVVEGKNIDTLFTVENGLNSNSVYNIFDDRKNNIWLLTGKGINRYVNGNFEKFNLDLLDLEKYTFYQGAEDFKGNLWFGSYELGVVYVEMEEAGVHSYRVLNKEDGLNNNNVLFLKIDANNLLWIGTNKGVNLVDLEEFYAGEPKNFRPKTVTKGIPLTEVNQNSISVNEDGTVWYGSLDGLVKFTPDDMPSGEMILGTYLNSMKVFLEEIDLNPYGEFKRERPNFPDNLVLPPDLNHISFDFIGLNYASPEAVRYKYVLEGFEDSAPALTEGTTVTYGILPPGEYTFKVWSSLSNEFDENEMAEYSFKIEAPIWKTFWFNSLMILLLIALTYSAYKLRLKRVNKRNRELERLIKERMLYEELLIQSEKDYRGLFENAHDAILIIDPEEHVVVDANISASKMYGYKLYELKGKHIHFLAKYPEKANRNISEVIKKGKRINFESIHRNSRGEEIILEINATEIFYRDKKAVLGILRDVTKRKLTEKNLERAKAAAEKSNRLKTEFLAQMSHEIRTPINTMLSFNSLIREDIEENISLDLTDSFGMIERAGKRVIRTIDLLLNMSQVQTGTYEPSFKKIDLYETIVRQLIFDYKFEAQTKNLALTYSLETEDLFVYADEYTVAQILHNLIDNAIKYTHEGEIKLTIGRNDKENLFISVSDTGIGIDKEYLPNLFEPFTQEEQGYSRQFEGNGLGLALVKSYCEINNAEISVESIKGEGTTFTLSFNPMN